MLDKSTSIRLYGLTEAMIAGFNSYVDELREQEGETFFSLTLFDTEFVQPYVGVPLAEVRPLDRESYVPNGNTALYDAIAFTAKAIEKRLKAEGREGTKVLIVTLTDGEENSSTDNDAATLAALVREYEATGNWTFTLLGYGHSKAQVQALRGIAYMGESGYFPAATGQSVAASTSSLGAATATLRSSARGQTQTFMEDAGQQVNASEAVAPSSTSPPSYTKSSLLDHLGGS